MSQATWIILTASVLGCFFAACHTALKTYSRKRLADLLEPRGKAGRAEGIGERIERLLLITGVFRVCLAAAVAMATLYHIQTAGWTDNRLHQFLIAGPIAAVILSIFFVAIPVSWARYRRERLLAWAGPILMFIQLAFTPLVIVLHIFDPIVRRISGVDLDRDDDSDLSDEVLSTIEDHEDSGELDASQKQMLEAVFDLKDTLADEVMTPRTDVQGLEVDATLPEVKQAILEFGHSRIPVYEESLDHILGLLYARDLIRFIGNNDDFHLRQIIREPFLVPESKPVRELLAEFRQRKVHMAIVLDEYGGTAGLVTIEDILEEIVGEIQDEYDHEEEEPGIRDRDGGGVEADGRVQIDDLEDHLGLTFPVDRDYDTVGGFVFAELGHIPAQGEAFDFDGYRVTVTDAERTKVLAVRVEPVDDAEPVAGKG